MNVLWSLFRYKSYFCAIEMMIMQNLTIFFLSFIVAFIPVSLRAQLHETGVPVALNYNLSSTETTFLNIDTVSITRNSTSGEVLLPEQAGVTISLTSRSNLIHGIWAKTDAGRFVWRASFEVPTAKSVNVYLDDLLMSHGDKLFVYSPDMKQVLGAFTQKNNRKHFSTGLIDGPGLVIEYSTGQKGKLPFKVAEIGAVMVKGERGFGGAGPCEVSVNCDEGFEWQSQKRGVARVLVKIPGKLFWCTGSLVNNTKKDGKPYFLTANHCGRGASADDYSTWVFDFDFESPNCELPDKEPEKLTFTGAKLIANGNTLRTSASDFKLLLLDEEIPDEYHMYFNGWDRSGNVPLKGVVIHHPQGDIKFISTYKDHAVSSYYYGAENPNAPFWKVTWSETLNGYGVTEGGSSGSPLFNEFHLIVGTLTGGDASCSNNTSPDYFGKFSKGWVDNGNIPSKQLKPWLDPDETGVTRLEGYFKGGNSISANFVSRVNKIISGNFVEFVNLSEGNINSYHWEFEGGEPAQSDNKIPALIYYKNPGLYRVKLTVKSIDNADSLIREDYINVIGHIFPNPYVLGNGTSNKIHILTGDTPLDDAQVFISDIIGREVRSVIPETGYQEIKIDVSTLSAGTYVITTIINGNTSQYKLVVISNRQD